MHINRIAVLVAVLGAGSFALAEAPAPQPKPAPTTKTDTKADAAKGEAPKADAAKSEESKPDKSKKGKLLDVNTASVDELKALPGITDEIANKIVAGRPYKGKDQLLKQNLVSKEEYAQIRPLIHAKQAKAGETKPSDAAKPTSEAKPAK
jgi:DNA uptake protein ComE-like DNA-binding protein